MHRGVTLIELVIGLAILGVLLGLALPAFSLFLQNTQIKNAAETALSGLNLARAEAVRRNAIVRFQFVSSLSDSCALSATALNWVVSRGDPSSHCAAAPAALDDMDPPTSSDPKIIQKKSAQEGTTNITMTTTGGSTVVFNALGRVVGAGITEINFANATGACEVDGGPMRCMRIMVSTGGQVKMCDPKVDPAGTDPRRCA